MADREELIPIDIQCNKLVDWLIDRRHCNIKWQTSAEIVKAKISSALKDMPSTNEMRKLLEGSCFHYFKCLKIVEVLKDTEKDSKNIFGMYSSQRMKDWKEIIKLYGKENLHLAELSNRLLRNLNYEIPATRKQIARCSQIQEECQKKLLDCARNVRDVERRYADECKKIGIGGVNVRRELLLLVRDVGDEFDRLAANCRSLFPVVEYYAAFVEFSVGSDDFAAEVAPLTKHISKLGNTTVYEWKYGVAPDAIVKNKTDVAADDAGIGAGDQIDWGVMADDDGGDDHDTIDFDIDIEDLGITIENAGEITCADDDSTKAGGGANNNNGDLGFEMIGDDEADMKWQIEEVSMEGVPNGTKLSSSNPKVAEGDDALSVLEHQPTRTLFINELIELSSFLTQRLVEMRHESDVMSINQFQTAPPILQLTAADELETMLRHVDDAHAWLTSTRISYLCRILDSPRFVDRLADTLRRQLALTSKYESQRLMAEQKQDESRLEQAQLHPKLSALIDEAKQWKKLIEREISLQYKNRPVNLMGTINML